MPVTTLPATAPAHLPEHVQRKWTDLHRKAFAQAKIDHPGNESAQRTVALKAANALLAVPAPASASDIDKLEEWQVQKRETKTVNGKAHRVCVTSDGRKYSHPVTANATAATKGKENDDSGDAK